MVPDKSPQGTDPTADEATAIAKKMEKIVDMLETQLDLLIKDKPRIDELHVGGRDRCPQGLRLIADFPRHSTFWP